MNNYMRLINCFLYDESLSPAACHPTQWVACRHRSHPNAAAAGQAFLFIADVTGDMRAFVSGYSHQRAAGSRPWRVPARCVNFRRMLIQY